ncbi:MAG: AsmA-like C-terminal region-containing protein [Chitinophagales bacterium]
MLRKLLYSLLAVILLFFIGMGLFLYIQKDFIKNQAIQSLNEQLTAKIQVNGEIDLVIFSSFPNIHLELNQVVIEDKLRKNETLANLNRIHLVLNPWLILKKDYTIEGILLYDGFLHLFVDQNGNNNFDIIKESETDDKAAAIKLSKIELSRIDLEYQDLSQNIFIDCYSESSILSGAFYDANFQLTIQTELLSKTIVLDKSEILNNIPIRGKLSLYYDSNSSCLDFSKNEIEIASNVFSLEGVYCSEENSIDLKANASGKQLSKVLALLPQDWLNLGEIKGDGNYELHSNLSGKLNNVSILADIQIKNGHLILEEQGHSLENLALFARYSNQENKNGSIRIEKIEFTSEASSFNASMDWMDMKKMNFHIQLSALLNENLLKNKLPEAFEVEQAFIQIDKLSFDLKQSLKDSLWYLSSIEGKVLVDSLKGRVTALDMLFDCRAKLSGEGSVLSAQDLEVHLGNNHLLFNGTIQNLLAILFNQEEENKLELGIEGSLYSKYFNLNDFLKDEEEKAKNEETISLALIQGHLSVDIDEFIYQELQLKNFHIDADARGLAYRFKLRKTNALGGTIEGILISNVNNNNFEINLECEALNIDIKELFGAFNNFGQEDLGKDNLVGRLSTQTKLSATWTNFNHFDQDAFIMQSHLVLKDGELINFAPLRSLSGKLEIEQLEHLYFTDMETDISISKGLISIPMSKIQSNLLSLKLGGTHSFDNEINYQLVLNLKNLLAAKFRKNKTLEEDFVNDAVGGINIYISMTGTTENPIISYDKKGVKEKIKEDFKSEKQEFKNLFKKNEASEFEKNEIRFEQLEEGSPYLEWEED